MVAHYTMRTYGVNQYFRFVEGIWLHRKSHQPDFFPRKMTYLTPYMRNKFWVPSCISNMTLGATRFLYLKKLTRSRLDLRSSETLKVTSCCRTTVFVAVLSPRLDSSSNLDSLPSGAVQTYWVAQKLPQIYTANHAIFPIRIRKFTVQMCGNWVTQYCQGEDS